MSSHTCSQCPRSKHLLEGEMPGRAEGGASRRPLNTASPLLRRPVQILRQRADQVIEDAGRNVRRQRAAALVDAVDPQAERRRVDVPTEQPADTLLDLRLEIGSARTVQRNRRLDGFGLWPATRDQI